MSQTTANGACLPCGLHLFERNRYFDGKLLVTRDFEAEQAYLRGKGRLHNSFLHGTGTVCGLKVEQHPNPACRHQYVVLNPGLAVDCCGNEIVVDERRVIDLRAEIEQALRQAQRFPASGTPSPANVYVHLAYRECDAEPVPALLDDCGCNEANAEHNRTRESYRLFVDLEDPSAEAADALEARLEWQHTLTAAHPSAMVADRELMRLYLAEWDGSAGWLRMYDAENHSLVARVSVGDQRPTAAARSNLGDLIYVAQEGDGGDARVVIFDQTRLETDPATAERAALTVPGGADAVRLEVSARDDSLFALTADGRLLRWSSDAIRTWVDGGAEPSPLEQELGAGVAPGDLTQSPDGRWMVVADGAAARLIVLNLAQLGAGGPLENLLKAFDLPAGDVPTAIELSYDGKFLYVLCADSQRLYRAEVRNELASFVPRIPDEGQAFSLLPLVDDPGASAPPNPLPLDLSVSPRDNWVYVLRRLFDEDDAPRARGDVLIVAVPPMDQRRGPSGIDQDTAREIRREGANTEGNALFQHLAFIGQRLYVAGETLVVEAEPTEGSVSVLYVDEAACDTFIRQAVEGCPSCEGPASVIVASIQGYRWNEPMVEQASLGPNLIDNFTHRPMAPSTNTLRQVIECMLEKGISEGIPGPRGTVGPEGPQGEPGARGPGITSVSASAAAPGGPPSATLEPIAGDPEGDQRLVLSLPRGEDGAPGPRGPGITEVTANTLPPGSSATASLQPIAGDLEGDQRLVLGIPRGAPGESAPQESFNRVIGANWHHDEVQSAEEFARRFVELGLVVAFERPVRTNTLHGRSVFALATRRDETFGFGSLECECVLTMEVEPVRIDNVSEREVEWLVGNTPTGDTFKLVSDVTALPATEELADGVRLLLPEKWREAGAITESGVSRLTVVLRGDWILDEENRALDGNHLWPGVPEGPTGAGVDGRPSGNGSEGGDWLSIIHLSAQPR